MYQKVWKQIDADTGEMTKIDMHSIQRDANGSVMVIVYTSVPNSEFDPTKLRRVIFDCSGHFEDVTDTPTSMMDAPPRSVIGSVSTIVCGQ
jgi:hypothetical protein